MGPVRIVGKVFFPSIKELGLTNSDLTPLAQKGAGLGIPYARAAQVLHSLIGIQVSTSSTRRDTLQAGLLLCQEWEQQATQLQQAPTWYGHQVFSPDGAMVPLVGGIWAEVKTLAIGTVEA